MWRRGVRARGCVLLTCTGTQGPLDGVLGAAEVGEGSRGAALAAVPWDAVCEFDDGELGDAAVDATGEAFGLAGELRLSLTAGGRLRDAEMDCVTVKDAAG